ncbi:MAG: MMPL family protein, partial [Desulfobacterales bacterium]|nr:MMPL family protein [Desulfobacterales bacterium]
MKLTQFKLQRFIVVSTIIFILFGIGLYRIDIDTDILNSLPKGDSVISDAVQIFLSHPIQDQIFIDVGIENADVELLVEYGNLIEQKLSQSRLFKKVGIQDAYAVFPKLLTHILDHLPILFSEQSLTRDIEPLLSSEHIHQRFTEIYQNLADFSGIGQSEWIAKDPLGFKDIILAKLHYLAPAQNIQLYKGKIISPDSKHLLIIANPIGSGTDTRFSRQLSEFIDQLIVDVHERPLKSSGQKVQLTPIGAYRAALDNENMVKKDVNYAIWMATIGCLALLFVCFSRPLLGVMSMVPAFLGPMIGFFVFSLFYDTIPLIVLGFGGALISMTVDYGIAYLLFLDRPYDTLGRQASREVWSSELIASTAAIGSFGALSLSGIPILSKLGQFTALGLLCTFLFVHLIFPYIFPQTSGVMSKNKYLQQSLYWLATRGKKGVYVALLFLCVMFFFATPEFKINISEMNSVSQSTVNAEKTFTQIWGSSFFSKIYLMIEGDSIENLQQTSDRVVERIDQQIRSGILESGFISSMIFPGEYRIQNNFSAWKT